MLVIKKEVIIGDCCLIFGDCFEVMKEFELVDVVVVDLFYGINLGKGFGRGGVGFVGWGKYVRIYSNGDWDK